MAWTLAVWVGVGCAEPNPSDVDGTTPVDTPSPTGATGDTGGTVPPAGPFAATCAPTDNALRFACTVDVDPPQPVQIAFGPTDGSGPDRVHASSAVAAHHEIGLYVLRPNRETTYVVTAQDSALGAITGTITTGGLPPGAQLAITQEGTASSPLVGFVSPCTVSPTVVIVDPVSGEVVWYHTFDITGLGFIDAASFTEDGTLLTLFDSSITEVDRMGNVILELLPGVDLENRVHHDVFRKAGRTYAIFQEATRVGADEYLVDGFYVFDGATQVGEWHLADAFTPQGPANPEFANDWSHANAVWVDDDRQVLLSLRHLSAIVRVDADTDGPTFGAVDWVLAHPASELDSDWNITSDVGNPANFEQQHNVHLLDDGQITMFDNRSALNQDSRVIALTLDEGTATANLVAEYPLDEHCDYQGGAWRTPAGNPLATCAPTHHGTEFDAATGDVLWSFTAECAAGFGTYIPRFVPVTW